MVVQGSGSDEGDHSSRKDFFQWYWLSLWYQQKPICTAMHSIVMGCFSLHQSNKLDVFSSIAGTLFCIKYQNIISVKVFLGKETMLTVLGISKRGSQNGNFYKRSFIFTVESSFIWLSAKWKWFFHHDLIQNMRRNVNDFILDDEILQWHTFNFNS